MCGESSPGGFRFCGHCGARLADVVLDADVSARLQLTVLFSDLVGSVALSTRLDPEDLAAFTREYQACVGAAVARFGGSVASYRGDGVLAYFGHPRAYEDDRARAVHAAWAVLEQLPQLNESLRASFGAEAKLRIGVHTGLVVIDLIGAAGREELAALGETVNIAARLSDAADENSVLVSAMVAEEAARYFLFEDLVLKDLKGLAEPFPAFTVRGPRTPEALLPEIRRGHLVGRTSELGELRAAHRRAVEGRGGAFLVVGEAGIGKSRLVAALAGAFHREGHGVVELRCSPLLSTTALAPLASALRAAAGLDALAPAEQSEAVASLLQLDQGDEALRTLVAQAVGVAGQADAVPLDMSPMMQRRRLLSGLVDAAVRLADARPLLVVVEDIQWIDPTTREVIDELITRLGQSRVLVVATARGGPADHDAWPAMEKLPLTRLDDPAIAQIAQAAALPRPLANDLVARIIERSDGVPLFAEELTRMLVATDAGPGDGPGATLPAALEAGDEIPETIQGLLRARLDMVPRARLVAQCASAIGRSFSRDLLYEIVGQPRQQIDEALDELLDSGLVVSGARHGEDGLLFKHALVRDQAYASMLRRTRAAVHERIARTLDRRPSVGDNSPAARAHHYAEARLPQESIACWLAAAQAAIDASAIDEATAHVHAGLALVEQLPEDDRLMTELVLQTTLGAALALTRGYGASGVEEAFGRARDIGRQLGDGIEVYPILRGLAQFNVVRARFGEAQALADRLTVLAETSGRNDVALEAFHVQSDLSLWLGDFAACHRNAHEAIARYDAAEHRIHASFYGVDPGVTTRCYASQALWIMGHVEESTEMMDEALAMAAEGSHPFTQAFASCFAAALMRFVDRPAACLEHASTAITIATRQGFDFWIAFGRIFRGWSVSRLSDVEAGIEEMHEALAAWEETGARLGLGFVHSAMAEVLVGAGQLAEARREIRLAAEVLAATGEAFSAAEIHRIHGEILAELGELEDARSAFATGLSVAGHQGARSYAERLRASAVRYAVPVEADGVSPR